MSRNSDAREAGGWWERRSLTLQAIIILALAIGPVLVSLGMLAVRNERDTALDAEIARHREHRILQSELLRELVDAETGARGFLLTKDRTFLEPYEIARLDVTRVLDRLSQHEIEEGDAGFDRARALAERELEILSQLVSSPEASDPLLIKGKMVMDEFRRQIWRIKSAEDRILTSMLNQRERDTDSTRTILVAGGMASAAGAALGGALLMAGIVRRLRLVTDNAERVANGEDLVPLGGTDEIALLSQQLQRSAQLLRARESELRQAKQEADRANRAKSDFISGMSHELRTPLNAILGFAQVLRDEATGRQAEDVGQILRAGRHLLSLINEVLDVSRIEAGQLAMSVEAVAAAEVVDECVELIAPLAAERGITISNAVQMEPDVHVRADRQRLKQVYLNLLSNAVKYNKDNGRVELGCSFARNRVRLTVRDTGPGISSASLAQLFVPFARLGAETTDVEGTGLGLALSLRLMQMMEGDMNIGENGPDGCEFWLELQPADAQAIVSQIDVVAEHSFHPPAEGSDITILQVEDNPTNIRLLERILKRRPNIHLVTVQQGAEAVDAARALGSRAGPAGREPARHVGPRSAGAPPCRARDLTDTSGHIERGREPQPDRKARCRRRGRLRDEAVGRKSFPVGCRRRPRPRNSRMSDVLSSKILVVDDEAANVALLERLLRKAGYSELRSSTDPREGVELWDDFQPDLLLLDLMMPHIDGFAFMEWVSGSAWLQAAGYVPILVLTADVTPPTRDRALASGAKDFLAKPFDVTEVRLRIKNLLETRSLHVGLRDANHMLEDRVRERTRALATSLHELSDAHAQLRISRQETIERLSIAAEFRDDDTGRHIHRMSRYTGILARVEGHDEERCAALVMASQMHDVGKIGIPDRILLKPGKLTPEERDIMERHAQIGHDILSGSEAELLHIAATVALTHHERFDGAGYPQGLQGEDIPLDGRIAAIADVFDALTSDRVYRRAFPLMEAVDMMKQGRGSQFDPALLDHFLDCLPEVLTVKDTVERSMSA